MTTLRSDNPRLAEGRTIFLKTVTKPHDANRLLQPANTNRKLGAGKKIIEKGRWKGMPLYQLVLEERATCPRTCQQWANCYGNNMYLAKRIDHRDWQALKYTLTIELGELAQRHPTGFVVRLHVLGDFFSAGYAKFWESAMKRHPELRIFGYTHRQKDTAIGRAIQRLNDAGAWVRWSDAGGDMSANVGASVGADDIQCPQEVGKTASCLTCGLCWQTTKPIKFLEH